MSRSDSRPSRPRVMYSPRALACLRRPLCRVSQVPRLICPHAPSPTTPESPVAACTHCFTTGVRLHHVWQFGRSQLHNEAESDSLALRLTGSLCPASCHGLLRPTRAPLPVEWVITG